MAIPPDTHLPIPSVVWKRDWRDLGRLALGFAFLFSQRREGWGCHICLSVVAHAPILAPLSCRLRSGDYRRRISILCRGRIKKNIERSNTTPSLQLITQTQYARLINYNVDPSTWTKQLHLGLAQC